MEFNGLPLHPLVIHVVVVFAPLAGVGGILVDTLSVELVYALGAASLLIGAALFGASNRVRA